MHSEPVIHDVDIGADARLVDEASRVDWHALSESDAASFGLALGIYRDALHSHEKRRVAWGTATGGVISIGVLAVTCLLCGSSPSFTLSVIVGTQMVRALWLYLKAHRSAQDARTMEDQVIDVARELAAAHPSKE